MPVVAGGAATATPPPSRSGGAASPAGGRRGRFPTARTPPRGRGALHRGARAAQIPDGAHGLETAVADDRDARGVVSAVLEALEPRQDDRLRRTSPHIADDPAHSLRPPFDEHGP